MLLLAVAVLAGCQAMDSPAEPILLPPSAEISSIEVTPNFGQVRSTRTITDDRDVEKFVTFVNSRKSGWKVPWHTFPGGEYTVVAKHGERPIAAFWPSSGHLGGSELSAGNGGNRLRPLTEAEWLELRGILGIEPLP